ncbi:MAG: PaaI family thioesterase [Halobacteriales archaeon]|nr:PaaI family thioesterase [Halobacteriales archaeon]
MADEVEIDLGAGPGHREADEHLMHLHLGRSFLAGPHPDDEIVRLRWYVREADGALVGRVWFGPGAQGPPGHAHGGSMAAVMDEALGSACWVAGHAVVAAELNTRFRNMLPLGGVYTAEAWVERVDGRKITTRGHILDAEGTIYAEATGLFIEMGESTFAALKESFDST